MPSRRHSSRQIAVIFRMSGILCAIEQSRYFLMLTHDRVKFANDRQAAVKV